MTSTNVDVDAEPARGRRSSWARVVPYDAGVATTRSPADSSDTSAAWIAAIPDAKRDAVLGALELGDRRGRTPRVVGLSMRP